MTQNNKNIRTVSFVDHLTLEYHGNLFSKALVVGDVDNDQVIFTKLFIDISRLKIENLESDRQLLLLECQSSIFI